MILAIEGPDGSGKSLLFDGLRKLYRDERFNDRRLRFANFESVTQTPGLWSYVQSIEARDAALFESLYDRSLLYVTDRFFAVTGPVYDRIYDRPSKLNISRWVPEVHVAYLSTPSNILVNRMMARGESPDLRKIERVIAVYRELLFDRSSSYKVTSIPAHLEPHVVLNYTSEIIERLLCRCPN